MSSIQLYQYFTTNIDGRSIQGGSLSKARSIALNNGKIANQTFKVAPESAVKVWDKTENEAMREFNFLWLETDLDVLMQFTTDAGTSDAYDVKKLKGSGVVGQMGPAFVLGSDSTLQTDGTIDLLSDGTADTIDEIWVRNESTTDTARVRRVVACQIERKPHEPLRLIGVHGDPDSPTLIRDLKINGDFSVVPVYLEDCSNLILENIHASNGDYACFYLKECQDIILRNLAGHNATNIDSEHPSHVENSKVFWLVECENILVEDCWGSGWCRKVFEPFKSSYITVRRFVGTWNGWPYNMGGCISLGYNGRHLLFEDVKSYVNLTRKTIHGSWGFAVDHGLDGLDGQSLDIVVRNCESRFLMGEGGTITSPSQGRAMYIRSGEGTDISGGVTITNLTVETDSSDNFGLYLDHRPAAGTVPNTISGTVIKAETNYSNW